MAIFSRSARNDNGNRTLMKLVFPKHQRMPDPPSDFDAAPSDASLLERLREGQPDAATTLYLRYAERLQRLAGYQTSDALASRVTSEDIVQTVFRTFFRRVAQGEYKIVDGQDLWKLLLVIALNKIRKSAKYHHAQKRDLRRSETYETQYFERLPDQDTPQELPYLMLKMTIDELVRGLPEAYQRIIELRIEGHTLDEIVRKTGRAKRTAERVLQEFREKLLQQIDSELQ